MRRWLVALPVTVFFVLVGFFIWRLVLMEHGDTPNIIPSVMINKPAPQFDLPPVVLDKPGLKLADLKGHVTLVNFFASWCIPCREEHPLLRGLGEKVRLVGIVYKDRPEQARAYLERLGDPYQAIGIINANLDSRDPQSQVGIDFGVTGVPESFLVDKQGVIRFKQIGPFTPEDINKKLLPLVAELSK